MLIIIEKNKSFKKIVYHSLNQLIKVGGFYWFKIKNIIFGYVSFQYFLQKYPFFMNSSEFDWGWIEFITVQFFPILTEIDQGWVEFNTIQVNSIEFDLTLIEFKKFAKF